MAHEARRFDDRRAAVAVLADAMHAQAARLKRFVSSDDAERRTSAIGGAEVAVRLRLLLGNDQPMPLDVLRNDNLSRPIGKMNLESRHK